jgi:amidohydrolase
MRKLNASAALPLLACLSWSAWGASGADIGSVMPKVIEWRRDIHQHPELGNREVRTSKLVADQLRALKIDVRTGIAHTGVVGVLHGGKPGPVVALRADMDALPVTEETDVPFKSLVKAEYRNQTVGVMHACGHDGHTAMLLGLAQLLAGRAKDLPGTVVFVFQPAEEGAPEGEEGGALLMIKEGVLDNPKPDAIFGMHLWSTINVGEIGYRSGPTMAGADIFKIIVTGRQTHGGRPWGGVDPIVAAAEIVTSMQTIVSRSTDITRSPVVVSVGSIHGGIRFNIIPETVELLGAIRTFEPQVREATLARLKGIAEHVAIANGATARFEIPPGSTIPLVNDPALTQRMVPVLQRAVGTGKVHEIPYITASEDYARYADRVPSFFFFVGTTPAGQDPAQAPANQRHGDAQRKTQLRVKNHKLLAANRYTDGFSALWSVRRTY